MLIRTLLLVGSSAAEARLERLLDRREVALVARDVAGDLEAQIAHDDIDLVITDGTTLGADVAARIETWATAGTGPAVVILQEGEDPVQRARLLGAGALAVLNPALSDAELRRALQTMARRAGDLARARLDAERNGRHGDPLMASSPVMAELLETARRVARSDSSVLVLGETGAGKERIARLIHEVSPRHSGPFVAVNCGAIPESLLESELFGHEAGAFTGAVKARRGYFELAHGGTLFLDELGDLPLHLQVKLLRALETREIRRLGSETPLTVDVRILAATNRDLEADTRAGRFRADLFFRLAVVTLQLPPLRERPEDIAELATHHLARFGAGLGRPGLTLTPEARSALQRYPWPGNVRELINVVERAALLCRNDHVGLGDLPRGVVEGSASASAHAEPPDPGYAEARDAAPPPASGAPAPASEADRVPELAEARRVAAHDFERSYLERLLRAAEGRVGEAARIAGVNPRTLYDLLRRHGLRKDDYRTQG